jgi:hypothetical protein
VIQRYSLLVARPATSIRVCRKVSWTAPWIAIQRPPQRSTWPSFARTSSHLLVSRRFVGIQELPPQRGINYQAFTDPSGGSADSFALAIGHYDFAKQTVVTACLREAKPPFNPELVTAEFSKLLRTYRINKIFGDRYAGVWPVEQFKRFNIQFEQSAKAKSELYIDLLPLINSQRIQLLDNPKLINQLIGLERRTARGGRDSIDHSPGGHDDLSNACAGLASLCVNDNQPNYSAYTDNRDGEDEAEAWQRWRRNAYYESGGAIKLW